MRVVSAGGLGFGLAVVMLVLGCGAGGGARGADGGLVVTHGDGATGNGTVCAADALTATGVEGLIAAIASDGTHVFFTTASFNGDPDTLQSVPVGGGTPTVLATGSSGTNLSSVTVDATNVYYFMDDYIMSLPKAGGPPQKIYSAGPYALAFNWDMDDTSLYWVDGSDFFQMPKSGGVPSKLFSEPDDSFYNNSVMVDATSIYYLHYPGITIGDAGAPMPSEVKKADKAGGAVPTSLASIDPAEGTWILVRDGGTLVYNTTTSLLATPFTTRIYALPVSGGAPIKLFEGGAVAPILTAASGFVYFEDDAALERVSVSGGPVVALPSRIDNSGASIFAHDATNVYWGEGNGCLRKAPL